MCFRIYDKKNYKLNKLYNKVYDDIYKKKKISKKDSNKIEKLLYKFRYINEGLGKFLYYPIKNIDILKQYFKFYNHYYEDISNIPYDKIIEIYNKYNYDISNEVEFIMETKIDYKEVCFSLEFKKINNIDFYELKKHLIKLSKIKTPYDLDFIKKDIKVVNKLIEYKENNYIIEGV